MLRAAKFRFGLGEDIKTDKGDTERQKEKSKAAHPVDLPESPGIKRSLLPAEHLEHAIDADKGQKQKYKGKKRFYEEYMHGTREGERGGRDRGTKNLPLPLPPPHRPNIFF
jgi:hypothetical protein